MDIAVNTRTGWTGKHTYRLALVFGQAFIVEPIDAQGTFFHHLLLFVDFARAVGAGPGAILATDALVVVDQHDAILGPLVTRARGAHRNTGRIFAMQAGFREMHRLRVREFTHFEGLHAIEKSSGGVGAVRVAVHHRTGLARGIPLLAAGHAGVTADTGVEIYDQGQLRHFASPRTKACHLPRAGSMPGTLGWVSNCGEVCFGSDASAL